MSYVYTGWLITVHIELTRALTFRRFRRSNVSLLQGMLRSFVQYLAKQVVLPLVNQFRLEISERCSPWKSVSTKGLCL